MSTSLGRLATAPPSFAILSAASGESCLSGSISSKPYPQTATVDCLKEPLLLTLEFYDDGELLTRHLTQCCGNACGIRVYSIKTGASLGRSRAYWEADDLYTGSRWRREFGPEPVRAHVDSRDECAITCSVVIVLGIISDSLNDVRRWDMLDGSCAVDGGRRGGPVTRAAQREPI